jgi:anaerobic selenocysteine-containing dehydrogenase
MKRAKEFRGDPSKFERITWDEAFDMIIDNYWETVNTHGVNSVSVWNGTGREVCRYHFELANDVLGTLSAVHPNSGWSCLMPRMTVMFNCMGSAYIEYDNAIGFPDRYDDPRWECPRFMLIWGRDQLRSNADGLWGHSTIEMMKRGMKLIVVDPRANWFACRAEHHLQLRPGTDAALALGILNVIINEELYDEDFVDKWCYGFDQLRERVQEYPLEKVEQITWVKVDDIRVAARCIAQKPSTLSIGLAVDQNPNCFQIIHAVLSIFAICGDMDIPGGCFMGRPSTMNAADWGEKEEVESNLEGLAKFDNLGKRPLGDDHYPANGVFTNNTHPDFTLDVLESKDGLPYPIKFAYIFAHNPIACMVPQPRRWAEGLRTIDFVAVADLVMTPTIIDCADLVLPIASFLEHDAITTNNQASQAGQVGAVSKCIEPLGECKSDAEIMIEIYNRLYPEGVRPWHTVEDYFTNALSRIESVDVTYPELKEKVIGQLELEYLKYEKGILRSDGQVGFNTRTGRIELYSTVFESLGEDPLPYYQEPYFSAASRLDLAEEYPLILTTGARRFTSFHSENRHIATLREIHKWPTLEINPSTAKKLGITEGAWVYIENLYGRVKQVAHLTPTVDENVVSADHAWWYPERRPEDLYDVFESNINALIPHEKHGKLGFGTHYKSMPCKVYPSELVAKTPLSPVEL